MPSTWSMRFRLNYQAPGENLNVWGTILNTQVFQLLEDAVAKRVAFSLSGSKTLSTANGADDEARCAFLDVTSGTGGTITIPPVEKIYLVRNSSSGAVTVTTGAGTTAVIAAGSIVTVVSDASNVRLVRDSEMATRAYVEGIAFDSVGDLPAVAGNAGKYVYSDGVVAAWRQIVVADIVGAAPLAAPSFTGGVTVSGGFSLDGSTKSNVVALPANDFDLAAADFFTKSISSNTTFTFSNATASKGLGFIVYLTISSAAVPTWPASVKWPGGVIPTLPNGLHELGFTSKDGGTTWMGHIGGTAFA